jgi:hypothetical protein
LAAETKAERERVAAEIRKANEIKADMKRREDELKLKLWKKKRGEKVEITDECKKNPFAKGCLPD